MTKNLCIYHGNCADGFGAAWAVRKALSDDVEFHAGVYQQPPPDVTGKDVILVDFSYKRAVLLEMAKTAHSIIVLDHHKSAAEDLEGIPEIPNPVRADPKPYDPQVYHIYAGCWDIPPLFAEFDMDRSGATMAWDFFHPGEARPRLIAHIEDRDLWRFKMDGTREIQANLFSLPYDFDVWDTLMESPVDDLIKDGRAIERKHFKDIREFIEAAGHRMVIAGYDVPALNAPYFWSSDAGHIMSEGEPFAACYWNTAEGRVFSLRSANDGLDVSEIATLFGGGGHKNAAGFSVDIERDVSAA